MLEKVEKFLSKIMGGTATDRAHKRIWPIVEQINEFAETYKELTDDELKAKTHEFRYRLRMGETVDDILPEAFAVVKDTCRRLVGKKWNVRGYEIEWDMIPYDVQLLGGVVLHEGKIAEMATGEGKTLVATAPLYLNALEGKGAHLITVNDYLAQRDCEWMGEIYKFLGLTVAAIHNEMTPEQRRAAYNSDITYGTNNEFGFDYLRDNMAVDVWSVVQRGLFYAIVDEVDSVLIDEARTPLIISGAVGAPRNVYNELKPVVSNIYNRQKELVAELFQKGKSLLESDEELAGLYLLRAHRGDPKNQGLLDLLTSEFWVKKLIERIQGQYEINKTMHEVDGELYYTIDEKSHVIDITEKGRIFLSGGHAMDVASKIQILDSIDEKLNSLGEKKNADKYFTQNAMGICNGLNFKGRAALAGVQSEVSDKVVELLDALDTRLSAFPDFIGQQVQKSKSDKNSVWRRYFKLSKRMDKAVNGFGENTRDYLLEENSDSLYKEIVDGFEKLLGLLKDIADVDGGFNGPKYQQDRRREYQNTFFKTDKQFGSPIGLTDAGKAAIISIINNGEPLSIPFIAKIQDMLAKSDGSGLDDTVEYFEFSDNQAFIKHITEKGRILLLGGNPDLYILPDRGNVEDRDQKIQKLLDQTLNQSTYDYTEKVTAVEELEKDVKSIYGYIKESENPESIARLFYKTSDSSLGRRVLLTDTGKGFYSNFAHQARNIVYKLDESMRKNRSDLSAIFEVDSKNRIDCLNKNILDELATQPFDKLKTAISAWQSSKESIRDGNPISLRQDLDNYLKSQFENVSDGFSLSRQFEETERIDHVMKGIFRAIKENDLSGADVQRLLKRYFEFDNQLEDNDLTLDVVKFNGLSDSGLETLVGSVDERGTIAERLVELLQDSDDDNALFGFDDDNYPAKLRKSTCSLLLDGLPYFAFSEEFGRFREEILKLSSKKVNNRSELEGLLPKEKSHLRGMGIMLDDREMNELISKAHAQNAVFSAEEIEHWFRIHLERKPRRILEEQRDKQWREYNDVEERVQNISQLLRAFTLYQKDVDYVVKAVEDTDMRGRAASARGKKAVMIVDQFTGRLMAGRRFSDGLHEALEAKEGVEVQAESQTLATITLQNFFRLYNKLAGMTGTAETEAQEFFSTYGIDVIVAPTNKPVIRDDRNDVIYRTKKEKYDAIISEAIEAHEAGQPVLIGTVSVDVSQRISEQFTVRGIPIANWLKKGDVSKELESGHFHTVLNAKFHKQEAEIVAKAGLPGAITIATNMAGRGTDIKLRPEVIKAGGLHIIGSEKHEARRIDRQLRGRSGRQGDPGSSRFYLSLEDDLMRLFGSDRVTNIMSRMGSMDEGERIEHPLITKSIERAQKKVEERNFEIRKNLLEYDNVLNEQRKIIYKRRQNLLGFADATDFIESKSKLYFSADEERAEWQLDELVNDLKKYFGIDPDFTVEEIEHLEHSEIKSIVETWIQERIDEQRHLSQLQERHRLFGHADIKSILKELIRLKIKLHNAGTSDTTKWNIEGLEGELVRIFGEKPDWLSSDAANKSAAEVEEELILWGLARYENLQTEHKEMYEKLTFAQLELAELFDIYLFALMENHLSFDMAEISWNVDSFLQDIERVFEDRPPIGSKEIRTIRRSKLVEAIREWSHSAQENIPDELIRHRILGYLGLQPLVGIISRFAVNGFTETNGKMLELTPENDQFLQKCFGISFEKSSDELSLAEDVFNQAREVYLGVLTEAAPAYDALLLGDATTEELVEAGILSISESVITSPLPLDEKRKNLGSTLDYVFLSKPQITIPDSTDINELFSFREDLVAWGLNLYKLYTERSERIRQERLSGEIIRDSIYMWIDETIYNIISNALGEGDDLDVSQIRRIEADCRLVFRHAPRLADESDVAMNPTVVKNELTAWAKKLYKQRVQQIGEDLAVRYERYYTLEKIDENWRQHLAAIDDMREGIGLRGYGQKDPLLEYKSEAYKMFVKMVEDTSKSVVSILFKVFDIGGEIEERQIRRVEPKSFVTSHSQVEVFKQTMSSQGQKQASQSAPGQAPPRNKPVVKQARVGRNEPCPCGSGKKYKNCCGKNV